MAVPAATDDDDDLADRSLIAQIARGDRPAFDEFYRRYARRVLAFVSDVVGSAELAEEAAGDTMIAVWRSAARYLGRARVRTWVLSIAHHKAIDALRRSRPGHVGLDALPDFPCRAPGPHDAYVQWEERFAFDLALSKLSREHRTVLQLTYGFGCSQSEIAEIVGCPIATVKTRIFYAKRRLRDALSATVATGEPA
jgi:RNA polymerase sigma-70 factor (ECF subfamily)